MGSWFLSKFTAGALIAYALLGGSLAKAQTVIYTTDFETSEGYAVGNLLGQNGWQVLQGKANIVDADASSGVQSVLLEAETPPTKVSQSFVQFSGQQVVFVDFYAKPTANADVTESTIFDAGSSRVGFATVGASGTIFAFDGNGAGGGNWVATSATVPIDPFGQSIDWVRITLRQDYSDKLWSLYVNGTQAATNLGFRDNTAGEFSLFTMQAPAGFKASLDDFYVSPETPLSVDANGGGANGASGGTPAKGTNADFGETSRALLQSPKMGLSPELTLVTTTFTSSGTLNVPTGVTSVSVLVVGGGAGGGGPGSGEASGRGGGAAGGVQYNAAYTVTSGGTVAVTVGAGGANDASGGNSVFGTITSYGGGRGATAGTAAGSGGSGGGGNYAQSPGSGTSGQGYGGGAGHTDGATYSVGGGGGGAGAAGGGVTSNGTPAGNGGVAVSNSITGSAVYYGGGGGGGGDYRQSYATGGSGGSGGGGAGATSNSGTGTSGTANTGGGGGGGGYNGTGGAGGSGIVIVTWEAPPVAPTITSATSGNPILGLAYTYQIAAAGTPTSFSASGLPAGLSVNTSTGLISGTPTTAGIVNSTISATNAVGTGSASVTFTVSDTYTFTTSGTFTVPSEISSVSVLVVGGGGGGGGPGSGEQSGRGGGGAGGAQYNGAYSVTPGGTIAATVGAGGANDAGGASSAFGTITSSGGGRGATTGTAAGSGGSGGGGNYTMGPGTGTTGQGSSGGTGHTDGASYSVGGGGGGAGAAGGSVTTNGTAAGTGGIGLSNSIIGSAVYYGGGGGGGGDYRQSYAVAGSGGQGGGGAGATADNGTGTSGTANTGGGGGGGGFGGNGGAGGSGVVIVSWVPIAPVITSATTGSVDVGAPYTYQIAANDSPTSFAASGLPPGLSINTSTGLISGTPLTAGTDSVTLTATNSIGSSTSALTITVSGAASGQDLLASTSFSTSDGYTAAALSGQNGWTVSQGTATVSTLNANSGSQSVELAAGTPIAIATLPFASASGETIEFCDFYALPVAETAIASSTQFTVESATFGFQQSSGHAVLEVFQGNGSGGGTWAPTAFTAALGSGNQLASWVHLSARLDFTALTWDLYANGQMVAASVPFTSNASTYLSKVQFQGDTSTPSFIDDLIVESANPLFADANNGGINAAWLTQYFGTTSVDTNVDYNGNGETVLQDFVAGVNPVDYFNGRAFAPLPSESGNSYSYDLSGRLVEASYSNGVNVNLTNDPQSNITSVANFGPIVTWRIAESLPPDGTGSGADTAILAGDGIPNLAKYAFGLAPLTAFTGSCPIVSITNLSGGYLELTYTRPNPAPTDIVYTVQVSSDGISWSSGSGATVTVSTTVSGAVATVIVRDATAIGSPAFGRQIRLSIQRIPQP